MARGAGNLTKLRSALKKLNPFGGRRSRRCSSAVHAADASTRIYVGHARREYSVDAELLSHPAMRGLLQTPADGADEIIVRCEPVLFDHLRWMVENTDPDQVDALDGLAEFYAY